LHECLGDNQDLLTIQFIVKTIPKKEVKISYIPETITDRSSESRKVIKPHHSFPSMYTQYPLYSQIDWL
jgi:hypothetical protein